MGKFVGLKRGRMGWAGLVRSATSFALQRALDEVEAAARTSQGGLPIGRERTSSASLQVCVEAEDLERAYHEINDARPSPRFSTRRLLGRIFGTRK